MESENLTFEVTVFIKGQDHLYIAKTYGVLCNNEPTQSQSYSID